MSPTTVHSGIEKIKSRLKIRILWILLDYDKLKVNDIVAMVNESQSAVSQSLIDLATDGILEKEEEKPIHWYTIKEDKKDLILDLFKLLSKI